MSTCPSNHAPQRFVWTELTSKFSHDELEMMPLSVIEETTERLTTKWAASKLKGGMITNADMRALSELLVARLERDLKAGTVNRDDQHDHNPSNVTA